MRLRWYNPSLGGYEWREMPETDEDALPLLDGPPGDQVCVEVYREWRELGASVAVSLLRAGQAAKAADRGHPSRDEDV